MKKEERLHHLFGDIDDDLVADAARKPIRKAVWMPLVAAAACVALSVGLWQGGLFDPTAIPVEPDKGTSTTVSTVEPTTTVNPTTNASTTTANPTEPSKTDPTKTTAPSKTTKPPTNTEPTKTTASSKTETTKTTTEPYILVGGEDDSNPFLSDSIPSLKDRLVSQALEEKMEEYRDVNAVFRVAVFWEYTVEDDNELDNFVKANEEYQSLQKQYEEAVKARREASKRCKEYEGYPYDDPRVIAARDALIKAETKVQEIHSKQNKLRQELFEKYIDMLEKERISYAAKYSKIEPVIGCGPHGTGYYMELTADAINELADRGGYMFLLASEKIDLSKPVED